MIYFILILTILNSALIVYCYKKQNETNKKILEILIEKNDENESSSEENKQHIDDMLKMREMYESTKEISLEDLLLRVEALEDQIKELQSQQLETGNNIVTLIQHAETMNNVTDASGLLAEHVTDLEEKLNLLISWMKEEIRLKELN